MFVCLLMFASSAFCAVTCVEFIHDIPFHGTVNVTDSTGKVNHAMAFCENNLDPTMKMVCKLMEKLNTQIEDIYKQNISSEEKHHLIGLLFTKHNFELELFKSLKSSHDFWDVKKTYIEKQSNDSDSNVRERIFNDILNTNNGNIYSNITFSNTTMNREGKYVCVTDEKFEVMDANSWFNSKNLTTYMVKNNSRCYYEYDNRNHTLNIDNTVVNTGSGTVHSYIKRTRRSTIAARQDDTLNLGNGSIVSIVDVPDRVPIVKDPPVRANYVFQQYKVSDIQDRRIFKYVVDENTIKFSEYCDLSNDTLTMFIDPNMTMFTRIRGYRSNIIKNICKNCGEMCNFVLHTFFPHVTVYCGEYYNAESKALEVPAKYATAIMNPIDYCRFKSPQRFIDGGVRSYECNTLDCNYILNDIPLPC